MSHSRIFMISQSPIDPDDFISEDVCYPDGGDWSFVGNIADYVDGETDREEDIKWFKDVLTQAMGDKIEFNDEENSFIFKTGFREEYFKDKKKAFLDVVEKMKSGESDWGFEKQLFASAAVGYINDRWSFYLYDNGQFHSMDSFVRNTGANVKFYIGNTIDYHY